MARGGVRRSLQRLVAGVGRLTWNPVPNDRLSSTIRTDEDGKPYVDKTFGSITARRIFDELDAQPYTPMLIFEGDDLWEIDVVAIATGDDHPTDDEIAQALEWESDLSAYLLAREVFRLWLRELGVSEENRQYAMREQVADYPFLVPEWDGEFRPPEWHRAFDQSLNMVYQ